jgi:hypothetical protein
VGVSYCREYRFKVDVSDDAGASAQRGLDVQATTDLPNPIFHLQEPNALRLFVLDVEA